MLDLIGKNHANILFHLNHLLFKPITCVHMLSVEVLLSGERRKCLAVIASKKADRFENADYWYIEDRDYDCNPNKYALRS